MSTGYEMKKEWMYFIAGAGLMAAVMSFNIPKEASVDCVAVADFWADPEKENNNLSAPEMRVYLHLNKLFFGQHIESSLTQGLPDVINTYASAYKGCLKFKEEK